MSSDSPVVTTLGARALASRRNGARSRGPKTVAGKARSARNALKHGLCAQRHVVLVDEDVADFEAFEAALIAELAPVGALQVVLAQRVAVAAWRLARADRLEAEMLAERLIPGGGFGLAVIRDGNGPRALPTLLRYRSAALAELMRTLRTLQTLQAEARAPATAPARRARLQPNEPAKRRQDNELTRQPALQPRDVPERRHPAVRLVPPPSTAPTTKPTRETTPNQQVVLQSPRRSPHDATAARRGAPSAGPRREGPSAVAPVGPGTSG